MFESKIIINPFLVNFAILEILSNYQFFSNKYRNLMFLLRIKKRILF